MKKIQRILMLGLVLCLSAIILAVPAAAANVDDETQIIRFEDGSYIKITIEEDTPEDGIAAFTTTQTTSGTKSFDHYTKSNERTWTFQLYGVFTYDGVTSKAINAAYAYKIYNDSWKFVSADYGFSGTMASATASFKYSFLFSVPVVLTLTCSPTGALG